VSLTLVLAALPHSAVGQVGETGSETGILADIESGIVADGGTKPGFVVSSGFTRGRAFGGGWVVLVVHSGAFVIWHFSCSNCSVSFSRLSGAGWRAARRGRCDGCHLAEERWRVTGVEAIPHPGEVVLIGASASVQFAGKHGFRFRVIAVDVKPTYDGWVWLDGYQLDGRGQAIARRKIFVRRSGLVRLALRSERFAPRS
jgi:hypothetical protein